MATVAVRRPPKTREADGSTRYEIRDASGALIAIHKRIEGADGKRMVWLSPDGDAGIAVAVADLPLYGAHLLGDREGEAVVVTEGEKAADALLAAGVLAVGTVTGAHSSPGPVALSELGGRKVILWPDADTQGHAHMRRIAKSLRGVAREILWVEVPDAKKGDDAADVTPERAVELVEAAAPPPDDDHFEKQGLVYVGRWPEGIELRLERVRYSSGNLEGMLSARDATGHLVFGKQNVSGMQSRNATAKLLKERSKAQADWTDIMETFCRKVLAAESAGEPIVKVGSLPRPEATPYLLHPLLPIGYPTIVYGAGGTGKSLFAAAVAVSVASGVPAFERWTVVNPAPVLILDWEADEDEWNERLQLITKGLGLDPIEIHYRRCIGSLMEQVPELSRFVAAQGIGLVVVDSVGMATPVSREGGDANEGALRLFAALRELRCTSLLIDHLKGEDLDNSKVTSKPYGSVYKVNLARSTYELRAEAESEANGVAHLALYHRKVNRGPKQRAIGLTYNFGEDELVILPEDLDLRPALLDGLPLRERIERTLAPGPKTVKEIAEALDEKEDTIRTILNRFKNDRFVKVGDKWGLAVRA